MRKQSCKSATPDAAMPFDRSEPPCRAKSTLFLSDLHLGALSSKSAGLLDFLTGHNADCYVLVGDVLDLWQPLLPHWTAQDQAVIDHLNKRVRNGARIIYVRGNHDPDPTKIPPHARLNATHVSHYLHVTETGKRFLVVHGDEVDSRLIRTHLMTRLGSRIDHALRRLDKFLRRLPRRRSGSRSTIDCLIKGFNALMYRGRDHERKLVAMAVAQGLDGVICGHFHIAGLHRHFGATYANCGDWVDSMTAVEDPGTGDLRLIFAQSAVPVTSPARTSPSLSTLQSESAPLP